MLIHSERGFDLSGFKLRKWNEVEECWKEATWRSQIINGEEHPIRWITSKKFREECYNKHIGDIFNAYAKKELHKYVEPNKKAQ